MVFWIAAAAITALVVALVIRPFFVGREQRKAAEFDVEVYKSQIHELDRERDEGLITEQEAAAAKAEIAKRLLAADTKSRSEGGAKTNATLHRVTGASVAAFLPLSAVFLYLSLGDPGAQDVPYASRAAEIEQARTARSDDGGNLGAMAERLAARLEEDPEDVEGWLLLARTYMTVERFADAVVAFARAAELAPDNPAILSTMGEAIVFRSEGVVTPEAVSAFTRAKEGGAEDPRSDFYLAQADYQAGRRQEALDQLVKLAWQAEPGAPWLGAVRNRVIAIAEELGQDGAALVPNAVEPPSALAQGGEERGPTAEDMAAAEDLSPEERQAMVNMMVNNLAARLEEEPMDFQGWMRLIRARTVMGNMEQAQADLDRALDLFARAPVPRAQLAELAGELNLDPGAAGAGAPGPTEEDMAAAAQMSDEDRQVMIQAMVDGLAARLDENPDDLDGWMRLARSYNVLGRPEDALAALRKANATFPEDTTVLLLQGRVLRSIEGVAASARDAGDHGTGPVAGTRQCGGLVVHRDRGAGRRQPGRGKGAVRPCAERAAGRVGRPCGAGTAKPLSARRVNRTGSRARASATFKRITIILEFRRILTV